MNLFDMKKPAMACQKDFSKNPKMEMVKMVKVMSMWEARKVFCLHSLHARRMFYGEIAYIRFDTKSLVHPSTS